MIAMENPLAGQGMVVLDIGGDVGALVVHTPRSMVGLELEICPSGARGGVPDDGGTWWQGQWRSHTHGDGEHSHPAAAAWPHVSVLARRMAVGHDCSAVFPGLRAGQYELWVRPGEPTGLRVTVRGGAVISANWPS